MSTGSRYGVVVGMNERKGAEGVGWSGVEMGQFISMLADGLARLGGRRRVF